VSEPEATVSGFAGEPVVIQLGESAELWEQLAGVPERPAVFLIRVRAGAPYLARTVSLRRRLQHLLREDSAASRLLNLRTLAERIEYWLVGSHLEASLVHYELARQHFPEDYRARLRLRLPAYLKFVLTNPFPRTQITTHLSGARALYYGPFRSRETAAQFQSHFLDLFQVRRCEQELAPSPSHPGCIYGEMNLCLRPCQQAVSREEYRSEVERALEFLRSQGCSLREVLIAARNRASEELDFEEAARQHRRIEKIDQALRLRDELAADLEALCGVAVTPSATAGVVGLWFLVQGYWQAPRWLDCRPEASTGLSMDQRLREMAAHLNLGRPPLRQREEHLALLARWYYSSWRDGEWLSFQTLRDIPYRRLVRAVSRVAATAAQHG